MSEQKTGLCGFCGKQKSVQEIECESPSIARELYQAPQIRVVNACDDCRKTNPFLKLYEKTG